MASILLHPPLGLTTLCFASQASQLCLDVPSVDQSFPFFYWPVGLLASEGYCYCTPHRLLFLDCANQCQSTYQFSFQSGSLCLQHFQEQNSTLKVYFIIDRLISSHLIVLTSVLSSFWINQRSKRKTKYFQSFLWLCLATEHNQ